MKSLMVDIETMSTHTDNALVLSIGAVSFEMTRRAPVFGMELLLVLDPREQLALGRDVMPSTVKWWQQQTPAARDHWLTAAPTLLDDAMLVLSHHLLKATEIWANGICFDLNNIASLAKQAGIERDLWPYNATRDARTVYRNMPELRPRPDWAAPEIGEAHNPVDDCYMQIWKLWQHWPDAAFEAA